MNAHDRNEVIIPRAGLTKLALEFIETNKGARSDQLAEHLGCDPARISIMLNPYLKRQAIKSTKVRVEGLRHPLAFYEIVPQTRRHDPRVATGSVPGRPMKLGDSLDGRQIAAAKGEPATKPVMPIATTHRDAPANQVSASPIEHLGAAAEPAQPAVAQNTGSAAAPLSPCDGPRRTPAPEDKAPAESKGAGLIRHLEIELASEESFTASVSGQSFPGMRIESRWNGLVKLVDGKRRVLIVLDWTNQDPLSGTFNQLLGDRASFRTPVISGSPDLIAELIAGDGA